MCIRLSDLVLCVHVLSHFIVSHTCNPIDCSLPGSSVHGILQVGILEWVTISLSRGSSWPRDWTQVSCTAVRLLTNWAMREASMWIVVFMPTIAYLMTQYYITFIYKDKILVGKNLCEVFVFFFIKVVEYSIEIRPNVFNK